MKKLFFILIILFLLQPVSAQIAVTYEKTIAKILPGDVVDCYLVIENPNSHPETIRSIVFYSNNVNPRLISDVGTIPAKSTYKLPFTFKAEKAGKYLVEVRIKTKNDTVKYFIPFNVIRDFPQLKLENKEIYLGEKNVLKVSVNWETNVTVIPLFSATPSVAYGKKFEFIYAPEKKERIAFRILFKNGDNRHEVVREVNVSWVEKRDILYNVTYQSNAYKDEAIEIKVGLFNPRNHDIFDISLGIGDEVENKPVLKAGEFETFSFYVTAKDRLNLEIKYKDEMGVEHTKTETLPLKILNEEVVQLCSYELDKNVLSGEVCNLGTTEVKNVVVTFNNKKYFVGSILPEDYEVFSIKTNKTSGVVRVSWKNLAGDVFEISESVKGEKPRLRERGGNIWLLAVSAVIAVVMLALALIAVRRR